MGTKADVQRILNNPVEFIKRLKIINKEGKLVNLVPNREQVEIISALEKGEPTLILKGRQIGSSTIVGAYFFWKIYTRIDYRAYSSGRWDLQHNRDSL